jgi:diguanylate cyclase (GGDEF)-like protein
MADTSQAIALARRIQSNLALKIIHTPIKFTMSIGAASSSAKEATFTAANLLKKADDALYQAKREGKNRICVFMDNGK